LNYFKHISTLLMVFATLLVNAQTKMYHKSEFFVIDSGAVVQVVGDFITVATGARDVIGNSGDLYITDSLINNGNQNVFGSSPSTGTVHFNGTAQQFIAGVDTLNFNAVTINNTTDTINLDQNIKVNDQLLFTNGNVLLDNNNINLGVTGSFTNENNLNRVVGFPGTISLKRVFTNSFTSNIAGIGLGGQFGDAPGQVTIVREHYSRPGPASGSVDKFFRISPTQTGTFSAPKFYYFDHTDLLTLDEDSLAIYASETNGNLWRSQLGTRNTVTDNITTATSVELNISSGTANDLIITAANDSCFIDPSSGIVFDTLGLCAGAPIWIRGENIAGLDLTWSDGQTSVDSIQVSSAGTYTLKMVNTKGCTSVDTVYVILSPSPTAGFNLSSTSICFGDSISFTNSSTVTEGSMTYAWDFGETTLLTDTSSLETPADFTFSEFGLFEVALQVTTNYGCIASYTENVTVKPTPIADFSIVDTLSCDLGPLKFTNNSSISLQAELQYVWDFGDSDTTSTKSPSHTYTAVGTYDVELISSYSGCSDTIMKQIEIAPTPTALFTASSNCLGDSTIFTNSSSISSGTLSYFWRFGDGNTSTDSLPNYLYANSGTYNVLLVATSSKGCVDSIEVTVDVFQTPIADFTIPAGNCLQGPVSFTNTSTITPSATMLYDWEFGDADTSTTQSPTHTYGADGTYSVTLISTYSICSDTISKQVVLSPSPVAAFTSSSVCLGDTTKFTNSSTVSTGTMTYLWNFGDNTTSTDVVPNHVYANSGSYNVKLVATSNNGCINSTTVSVAVFQTPIADFTIPTGSCLQGEVTLTNTSTITPSVAMTYDWAFGDNQTSTNQSPSHTYGSEGTYDITLISSYSGCSDAISKEIIISPVPVVAFNSTSVCIGDTTKFTNSSSVSSGSLTYLWEFGDNMTSTAVMPNHVYASSGTYSVLLVITSNTGCVDSVRGNTEVYPNGTPDFTVQNACQDENLVFTNLSSGSLSYLWKFSDGDTSSLNVPVKNFSTDGAYSINLFVTTNNGCVDSVSKNFTVYPLPTADFMFNNGCEETALNFTNTSLISSGSLTYNWDFDHGLITSSNTNEVQQFSVAGLKDVELISTSLFGCADTIVQQITVFAAPIVDLSDTITTCGNSYVLDALNPGSKYFWSTGSRTQTITALITDDYFVTVTNNNNCVSSDTVYVGLNLSVKPKLGEDISFCVSGILDAGYPGATFSWSPLASSSQQLTVSTAGEYIVEVMDQNSCVGSDTINVGINALPTLDLGNDTTICSGMDLLLDPNNNNVGNTYQWSDNSIDANLTVNSSDSYWVNLSDVNNCLASDTIVVSVAATPTVTLGNDTIVCDRVVIVASSINGASFSWNGGLSSNDSLVITSSSMYYVETSIGTGINYCESSDTINVVVNSSPIINLGNDTTICEGVDLLLDPNNSAVGNTYLWNDNSASANLLVSTTNNYWVDIVNANNCSASDTIMVSVASTPVVDLGNDTTNCDSLLIIADKVIGGTYNWNNGLSNADSLSVFSSGVYFLEVSTGLGVNYCAASDSVVITINDSPINDLGNDTVLCDGLTLLLDPNNSNAGNSYLWSNISNNSTLLVSTTANYSVEITDLNNCSSSDTVSVIFTALPTIFIGNDTTVCDTLTLFTDEIVGATYDWNNSLSTTNSLSISNSDTYFVEVTIGQGVNRCSVYDSIVVVVNNSPAIDLGADTSLCNYQTLLLDAGAGFDYLWNDGTFLQTKLVGSSSAIWVKITDVNGCSTIDSIDVNINPDLNLELGADKVICSNQQVLLAANVLANSYVWSDVNRVISTTSSITVGSGNYWLTVEDSLGCIDKDSIEIVSSSLSLEAHFLTVSSILVTDTLKLINLSLPVSTFTSLWDFGDSTSSREESPIKQYASAGVYNIKLSVTNNFCLDSLIKPVTVVNPKQGATIDSIYVPSKFLAYNISPNPNKGSFVLEVELSAVGAMETTIFNILGEELYQYRYEGAFIQEQISLKGISRGIYFVRSRVSNQVRTTKIIIN
jgi:PKD repeat protein